SRDWSSDVCSSDLKQSAWWQVRGGCLQSSGWMRRRNLTAIQALTKPLIPSLRNPDDRPAPRFRPGRFAVQSASSPKPWHFGDDGYKIRATASPHPDFLPDIAALHAEFPNTKPSDTVWLSCFRSLCHAVLGFKGGASPWAPLAAAGRLRPLKPALRHASEVPGNPALNTGDHHVQHQCRNRISHHHRATRGRRQAHGLSAGRPWSRLSVRGATDF